MLNIKKRQIYFWILYIVIYHIGQRVKGFTEKTGVVKEGIKSVSSVPRYVSQSIKSKGEIFRSLIGNFQLLIDIVENF